MTEDAETTEIGQRRKKTQKPHVSGQETMLSNLGTAIGPTGEASTNADLCTNFIADGIGTGLLSQRSIVALLVKALDKETDIPILAQTLEPLIMPYGRDLEDFAKISTEMGIEAAAETQAALTISRKPQYIANSMLRTLSSNLVDIRYRLKASVGQSEFESSLERGDPMFLAIDNAALLNPDILLSGPLLNPFLVLLRRVVYTDPLEAVTDQFRDLSNEDWSEVDFKINWELPAYIKQEVKGFAIDDADMGDLGSLLVTSGSEGRFFMDTCEKYMIWRWPDTARILLEVLDTGHNNKVYLQSSDGRRISVDTSN